MKPQEQIHDEENEYRGPSKSQLKRDALEILELGRKMVHLNPQSLKKLPLTEELLQAILSAKTMKQGALKRQVQFIGKLLRQEDDLTPLRQAVSIYFK
jgi:ribosome-associated protein